MTDPKIKIQDAIEAAGGTRAALADLLGISRSAVTQWSSGGGEFVPTLQAYRIAHLLPEKFGDKPDS